MALSPEKVVLKESEEIPAGTPVVRGYDFNNGIDYHEIFNSYKYSGFQATSFGLAVEEVGKMIEKKKEGLPSDIDSHILTNCTIFLGYTSNMVSCGVRETIRFLVQHKYVDCIVTTAGGVEEDLIKCLAPTYLGDWSLPGKDLRRRGLNRIGNLIVPNNNYCKFEDWITPHLDEMLRKQQDGTLWSPSKMIEFLGQKMDNTDSIAYWAAKNKIPVFCPALTDGSLGDMMYFHGIKNGRIVCDINYGEYHSYA